MPSAPTTTARALLLGLTRAHACRIVCGAVFYLLSGAGSMSLLWLLGRIVDAGVIARDRGAFAYWLTLLVILAVVQPLCWSMGFRLIGGAEARSQRSLLRCLTDHLNTVGTGVRGSVSAGELLNLASEDTRKTASAITDVGLFCNSLAMFVVGSFLVWSIHPLLGTLVVAGGVVTASLTGPLLGRLQRHQSDYRTMTSDLSARAADIVGGLRVLRGIGGEARFAARYRERSVALRHLGYRVADSSSWIHALKTSIPILFVAAITWAGALLATDGTITIGGLVSAFGFATSFIAVSGVMLGAANFLVGARVAAHRIVGFLSIQADVDDGGAAPGSSGELYDPETGLRVPRTGLIVVATAETTAALAACERLSRHRRSEAVWGDKPLAAYALAEVRQRIMLLTDEDHLFAGTLGETLRAEPSAAHMAIEIACAVDLYTSLGGALDARVAEGGRNLSGGQRQRLRLARALAAMPETLLAVEPTSAVDAHTESLVAERVSAARAMKSTVVVTTSPLWSARADRVAWMVRGKVHAVGTHAELLNDPVYRALTSRGADRGLASFAGGHLCVRSGTS